MQRASYKDIQNALLLEGVEALHKIKASKRSFRKAIKELAAAGHAQAKVLEAWCKEHKGFGLNNKGRAPPKAGTTRKYRVQVLKKTGRRFIRRLPVAVLGECDVVEVTFATDGITLKAAT